MKLILENWRDFSSKQKRPFHRYYTDKVDIDEDGMVTLYHIGEPDLKELDPMMAIEKTRGYTKQEYKSWDRPRVFFFTSPGQEDLGVGRIQGTSYTTKVPWDELYPIYRDPLQLTYPDKEDEYKDIRKEDKETPHYYPINRYEMAATLADKLGYKGFIYHQSEEDNIIVAMWHKTPVERMNTSFY
jgi:hypothetical protein